MILWNVKYGDKEFNIDIGDCTILVGQDSIWYELVRIIDDFFNARSSTVQIEEDMSLIQKKDWNCYFIPFDAQLQMDKIVAKSPLNEIVNECIEQLSISPAFLELKETWGELQDEVYFVNESLRKYEVKATINDFEENELKRFISLRSTHSTIGPIENKSLLLRLIAEGSVDKKTLIIIELPELFSGFENLLELESIVRNMKKRGYKFIIVTDNPIFKGRRNYTFNNRILNEATLELLKRKVIAAAPFAVEEHQFVKAKQIVLKAVDNSVDFGRNDGIWNELDDGLRVLCYMIFKELGIPQPLDTTGFPLNIMGFMNDY